MAPPLLSARSITKRFSGVLALDRVSFELELGEIHALCGENGAGKSTLIKLLGGIHPWGSYDGVIELGGEPVRFHSTRDAEAAGIAVIHQELALVPELTVAENLVLGHEPTRFGLVDWDRVGARAQALLSPFNLDIDLWAPVGELGVGHQQLVEIAKALGKQSRILVFDEPTAALAEHEAQTLLAIVRELQRRQVASIYISHKLDEVLSVADRITVLRDGQSVITLDAAHATKSELVTHMVGRRVEDLYPWAPATRGRRLLEVHGLSVAEVPGGKPRIDQVSLEVHSGEVVGIGGLMGAGRSELLLHLFGAWGYRLAGQVTLDGSELVPGEPRDALAGGMVLVSEDRKRYGLHLDHPVGFNLSLSNLDRLTGYCLVDGEREFQENQRWVKDLRIKTPSLETMAGALSGGNQQKVVLGKALMTQPRVVLLDEPTRGIDVGAKAEIYELIRNLAQQGKAVLLVSSELPELMGVSDRIIMLHRGRMGGSFTRREATAEALILAAMGQTLSPSPEPPTQASHHA